MVDLVDYYQLTLSINIWDAETSEVHDSYANTRFSDALAPCSSWALTNMGLII